MSLSKNQLRHLRSLVHNLKPVILMGQNGLTENVIAEIDLALEKHELIKIKIVADDREERKEIIEEIANTSGAIQVHSIGNMASYFLRNPKKPKIALPSK